MGLIEIIAVRDIIEVGVGPGLNNLAGTLPPPRWTFLSSRPRGSI